MLSKEKMRNYYERVREDKWRYNQRFRPEIIEHRIVNYYIKKKIERCLKRLKNRKIKLLDIGCGTCFYHGILKDYSQDVSGLDFSYTMLSVAAEFLKRTNTSSSLVNSDVESLPLKDNSFDVIFCMDVLHHLEELDIAFEEIKRVLKNDGYFFGIEVNPYNIPALIHNLLLPEERGIIKNPLWRVRRQARKYFDHVENSYIQFLPFFQSKTPQSLLPAISKSEEFLNRIKIFDRISVYFIIECRKEGK